MKIVLLFAQECSKRSRVNEFCRGNKHNLGNISKNPAVGGEPDESVCVFTFDSFKLS